MTIAVVVADLGTAIVLVRTAAVVFFVAGLETRYIVIACAMGVLAGCIAAICREAVSSGARGQLCRSAVQDGRQDRQARLDSRPR